MGVFPQENFEKSLCLSFFLTLLIMSLGLLRGGVKIDPPQHVINKFSGVESLYRGV